MRRAIVEWGFVVALVIGLASALIWVDALLLRGLQEPLALIPGVYMRVGDGRLGLFSELGRDWKPRPEIPEPAARSWVQRYIVICYPGLEYHHRLFASGRTIWSLEISLVVPLFVSLTFMTIFWRIGRGGSRRSGPGFARQSVTDFP